MRIHKHLLHTIALSTFFVGFFALIGGAKPEPVPGVLAQSAPFSSTAIVSSINSSTLFMTSFSSTPNTQSSFSSDFSSVGLSFSSVSVQSVPTSSFSFSTSYSSFSFSQESFSSFSFSQESFSSFSFSQESLSSTSFSFTSVSIRSQSSIRRITTDGGSTGGTTQGGQQGGGTTIGGQGGLIGIGGNLGGVSTGGGGVTGGTFGESGTTGGGGVAPVESAKPAKIEDCKGTITNKACVPLIQPLGGNNTVAVKRGAQTFIDYFTDASSLIITISVGFAVLWILLGSYMIMVSGSDGGKRSAGKEMITWALVGLIIVNFAGFFLRTLNSLFFT